MEFTLDKGKLTITMDITKGALSKSGKSVVVASTNGFVSVPNSNLKIGLNVIKPKS